jgi:hypothetical protein
MAEEEDLAQALARKLDAVSADPILERKAAARFLAGMDPTDGAELLHLLIQKSRAGSAQAHSALWALANALSWEAADIPQAETLKRLASLQDFEEVALLFAKAPPSQVFDARIAAKKNAQAFGETLGHQKTKARLTKNKDLLAKLATNQDPSVIAQLLINPTLTEELVIRIAARRPTQPEPLQEIWKSPKWSRRPAVRRALVFNPYLPPETSAKIVPLLGRKDLEEVSRDKALADAIRRQAQVLLQGNKEAAERMTPPMSGPRS